ncbi:MAG: hypothetical protein K6G24_06755 [Lachnospiraceae bacterium]|nr:hypothetical protein [Lachnospiraceae bacterium]
MAILINSILYTSSGCFAATFPSRGRFKRDRITLMNLKGGEYGKKQKRTEERNEEGDEGQDEDKA